MAFLFDSGVFSVEGLNGEILPGTTLGWYVSGTSTPLATYFDEALSIPNPNPVIVGADGRLPPIWLQEQSYKLVITLPEGTQLTREPIRNPASSATGALNSFITNLASSTGATLIGWIRSAAGAVMKTVSVKLGFRLDAEDFMPSNWNPATDTVTAYMQAAITEASASGRTLYLPPAFKSGSLTVPSGVHMRGVGKKTIITSVAGTYNGMILQGSDIQIQDLHFLDAAKTGGANFTIECGTETKRRIWLNNILAEDTFGFITDSGTGTGYHIDARLLWCHTTRLRGPGIVWNRCFAYGHVENCSMDMANVSADFKCYQFHGTTMGAGDAGGITILNAYCGGSASTFTTAVTNQRGFEFIDMASVSIDFSRADGMGELSYYFENVNDLTAGVMLGTLCVSGAIFKGVTNSSIGAIYLSGRNYLAYKPADKDGLFFDSGNSVLNFGTVLSRDWTGNGINKAVGQPGPIAIGQAFVQACTKAGIKSGTATSGFLVGSASLGGNLAGHDIDIGGAADVVRSAQISSGAVNNYVGPATA